MSKLVIRTRGSCVTWWKVESKGETYCDGFCLLADKLLLRLVHVQSRSSGEKRRKNYNFIFLFYFPLRSWFMTVDAGCAAVQLLLMFSSSSSSSPSSSLFIFWFGLSLFPPLLLASPTFHHFRSFFVLLLLQNCSKPKVQESGTYLPWSARIWINLNIHDADCPQRILVFLWNLKMVQRLWVFTTHAVGSPAHESPVPFELFLFFTERSECRGNG